MFVLAMLAFAHLAHFHAGSLDLDLDGAGCIQSVSIGGGPNLAPNRPPSPLLSLRVAGHVIAPDAAGWNARTKTLTFLYGNRRAIVHVETHDSHLSFELRRVQPAGEVEVAIWGPIATVLKQSVGETIGVVQGNGLAFGLQVLNPKTLGGFPNTEDDIEPSYDIFETGNLVDMTDKDAATENYRGDTARPTDFGSVVQAYTRNRSKTRIIANWAHPFYTAPAFKDGGVVGSKIALFGCRATSALETIGRIELAEGLPHPMLDGIWGKMSPTAHQSYLVMGFDTHNLDECLKIARAAGLRYLYSDGCFDTWGHFKLNPGGFPKNWESMKECVDRASAQGVRLGVHTLSNFITTNDPYVTPVPDPRLAEVGESVLTADFGASETDVTIADPKFFNEMANNTLRTVRVGDELIEYGSVSGSAPWTLLQCKRGAFGTRVAGHAKGSRIAKLMDHGYRTFLTNAALTKEVAHNLADFFNKTGLRQTSMDGLEGNWSTGMGQYGRTLFAKSWYDALGPELKGQVINDASNPGAYNWHINTRMNWGEPWYAGFRKSQTQYRLKNQHYFRRNLMPGMLGWFQVTSETTPEDIQWLLARAAGFDAGFCITASLDSVRHNPHEQSILALVKAWESARNAHVFPPDLLPGLQNIENEYELVQASNDAWSLTPMTSHKFEVGSESQTVSFEVGSYAQGGKLILQVPANTKFSQWEVRLDANVLKPDWPAEVDGYRYLSLDLSNVKPGTHKLSVSGHLGGGSKPTPVDGELRIPRSEPVALHPRSAD
ncbi:MAG: hypothetical protein P4L46_22040 [Fimbriimonas sp.]|nr:hypothetical protein [Fimbriimonas sp.]